jgi:cytochrome c oxidase accessory protein FixG
MSIDEQSVTKLDGEGTFRDTVGTISDDGKRAWIYPKKPSGRFTNARTWVSVLLLIVLFGMPFIRINGLPMLMINIPDRKFIVLGQLFWPQDFYLLVLGLLSLVVFIVLFTVVFGRVFCGWICPQTIFMEMVFRKVEYWIEGDYRDQKKLNESPWDGKKAVKKFSKWGIFYAIAFVISNTFLAYIIGTDELFKIISEPVSAHITGFSAIVIFSGVFYFVFAYMREQVCIVICPYGRLQGVMLDRDSVVVAYDYVRGDPRGPIKKNQETQFGDCVDCHACVRVCPTGIDIRNGTQLECINCTACIDACDDIMDKVGRPRGLVRYDSDRGIAESKPWKMSTRAIAYSSVLILLVGGLSTGLAIRKPLDATVLRSAGLTWQDRGDGQISNLYQIKILNKTNNEMPVTLQLAGLDGELQWISGQQLVVPAAGMAEDKFFVILESDELGGRASQPLELQLVIEGEIIQTISTNFMAPTVGAQNQPR